MSNADPAIVRLQARDPEISGRILVIGADLVMPKLFYFGDRLRPLGIGYTVYTHDVTAASRAHAEAAGAELIAAPPHRPGPWRLLRDLWTLIRRVKAADYRHAELYSDYHMIASLFYLLILRLKNIPVILWCRGELFDWPTFTWWERLYFHIAIPLARRVILKERYMIETLRGAGIHEESKTIELHNSVPVPRWERETPFPQETIRLLFMNSFKTWRNVSFCVELAVALRDSGIPFSMKIVGDKPAEPGLVEEARRLREGLAAHGLGELVTVHPFTDEPRPYYEQADIFVLPANVIYCNFGLLEAMAYGLVPVVNSRDHDFGLIIEEGVSGFGLPLVPDLWVDKIQGLAHRREEARAMSRAARARIRDRFSTAKMFDTYACAIGITDGENMQLQSQPRST